MRPSVVGGGGMPPTCFSRLRGRKRRPLERLTPQQPAARGRRGPVRRRRWRNVRYQCIAAGGGSSSRNSARTGPLSTRGCEEGLAWAARRRCCVGGQCRGRTRRCSQKQRQQRALLPVITSDAEKKKMHFSSALPETFARDAFCVCVVLFSLPWFYS